MKQTKLLGTLLLLLFMASCDKKDIPITLHYVENNTVNISYPNANASSISILGGDGNYSASCNNLSVLEVELDQVQKMILLRPQSTGNATVTINDQSGHTYLLNVTVSYAELKLIIDKQDVIVTGDKLSEVQKAEITQKALLTLPVKVNGGFRLIFNNTEQVSKGQAFIYKESYGGVATESVFEFKRIEKEINGTTQSYNVYIITKDGEEREFIMNRYLALKSKSSIKVPAALIENITEQFKTDYPDVETVYTQQRLK